MKHPPNAKQRTPSVSASLSPLADVQASREPMIDLVAGHEQTVPKHPWIGLVVFLVVCFAAAGIGGAVTAPKIDNWYATLAKPAWNPPDWVFGPVWSALYFCMAIAAWLVWRQGGLVAAATPLAWFTTQLVLNLCWSCLFFGLQEPGVAFFEVLLLWAAIAVTMVAFWRRSAIAGLLLAPYLAWVTFASVLNCVIWRLNG